jgi:hypothetical protein
MKISSFKIKFSLCIVLILTIENLKYFKNDFYVYTNTLTGRNLILCLFTILFYQLYIFGDYIYIMRTLYIVSSQRAHLKTIIMMLVSAIFRQFGNCFEPFDIAGLTQRLTFLPVSKARTN